MEGDTENVINKQYKCTKLQFIHVTGDMQKTVLKTAKNIDSLSEMLEVVRCCVLNDITVRDFLLFSMCCIFTTIISLRRGRVRN